MCKSSTEGGATADRELGSIGFLDDHQENDRRCVVGDGKGLLPDSGCPPDKRAPEDSAVVGDDINWESPRSRKLVKDLRHERRKSLALWNQLIGGFL